MIRRLAFALAAFVAVLVAPSGVGADVGDTGTCKGATWGQACVDIDLFGGQQRIDWWLDDIDPPADGYCVRLYVQVLLPDPDAGWRHLATSCGPPSQGSVNMLTQPGYGPIDATVRITRGPWPGVNWFSIFNSMV